MGLDLRIKGYRTKDDKIGSYIGFNDFRRTWARHLGFTLSVMEGFGGTKPWTNEPLQAFFNHSDCDGEISPEDCKEILAQALIDAPLLTDSQSQYSFPILIRFCRKAVEKGEPIEFR